MKVLLTGGAGYIGSHTCVELFAAGHEVVLFDNLSNANKEVLGRIERISGKAPRLIEGDVRDLHALETAMRSFACEAVVHFAGLKAVGESVEKPMAYYDNNVVGSLRLLEAMKACNVPVLLFSSSATVYGNPQQLPLREDHPLSALNPYGQTKLTVEHMLRDVGASDPNLCLGVLRYFNPVGAHESGLIGEDPKGIPNNLLPFVSQVAVGKRDVLNVWGNDYPTKDGTGVRDYIHVVDLARGHVKALEALAKTKESFVVNLGTGKGYSVLEIVRAFEKASGKTIPVRMAPRRAGDIATCYADATFAKEKLGWIAEYDLDKMCSDAWNWQSKNPNGYL